MNIARAKFQELLLVTSLRSQVFSEYFNTLMMNHNVKSIRIGMKILIIYFYCEIVSSHMAERGVLFRPLVAICAFCIFFLIYALTVKVNDTQIMTKLSSVNVLMCMTYTLLLGMDLHEVMETHYSLTIVIILMMYTLFRLHFLITMLLSVIYIVIFLAICNYRIMYVKLTNGTEVDERSLSHVRLKGEQMQEKYKFLVGQSILFLLIYLTGLYLRFFNSIRRKSAFLKLAQNAESKMKMNSAIQIQIYWIEAIMPSSVKDEFLKQIGNKDSFNLVYCKMFENVSILFADIVGFTEMSSNKTAAQLVFLLNDLYNRFDEHGKFTNCEKIGTLGDCYYCVSGCPVPRPDHAMCCIEMGLGMCRMILNFNKEHLEKVNMRVGVHSGRVIAAIIGNQRFRFDVFSNDVMIANSLESSGLPGLVHVSEDTFKLVRHAYVFKEGENLEIKKEQVYGLSGMIQKTVTIKTYFVIPEKAAKKMASAKINNANENRNAFIGRESGRLFGDDRSRANTTFQRRDAKIKQDLGLIRFLQRDPDRPVEFFQNPPINKFFLTFLDKEIEAHYLYHSMDQIKRIQIDSVKVAPLFDAISCLIYSTIILLASYIMIPGATGFSQYTPMFYTSGVLLTVIVSFTSLLYKSEIDYRILRKVFFILNHPIARLLFDVYLSSLPSLLVLSIIKSGEIHDNYQYSATYFTLTIFALMGHCMFTASYSSVKHISTGVFTLVAIFNFVGTPTNVDVFGQEIYSCTYYLINQMDIQELRNQISFTFQLMHICLLIYHLTRESEKNIRIHFYASREAEIRNDEAKREKRIAESLLYNIIPKYVFAQIVSNKMNKQRSMRFSYAHAIPNAGVLFAGISNFFSSYYREDYKSGEVALKLLHSIISTFDSLLRKPVYYQVEKIKTINDCYMVASGLNTNAEVAASDNHLITLLNFAFDLRSNLYTFNEQNIVGTDTFKLKIGYNYGPVTAGIIGNTKPLYDIWGDTVNVASRMYSTAPSNHIQVPGNVEKKLNKYFEFKERGFVSIKGKGEMLTYIVVKSLGSHSRL